jgi:hypothetical protein
MLLLPLAQRDVPKNVPPKLESLKFRLVHGVVDGVNACVHFVVLRITTPLNCWVLSLVKE